MKDISYWLNMPYRPHSALIGDIETDIVIVGGGITGVSVAYHAAKAGFRTVLIEKDTIASGSAGRNGGMVVEGMELDFCQAVQEFGADMAKKLWMNTVEARKLVQSLVQENNIECDLEQPGSLYLSTSEGDDEILMREAAARKEYGISYEIIEEGEQLNQTPFYKELYNPSDMLLHPVKFVRGLVRAGQDSGLVVYENTPALDYDVNTVTTPKGIIHAKKVVIALESASQDLGDDVKVIRSQAIVTEPLSDEKFSEMNWKKGKMFWTTGPDYISCRTIGQRLFSCKTLPLNPTHDEMEKNKDWQIQELQSLFPMLTRDDLKISHMWSGLMVCPKRHHPRIKNDNGYFEIFGQSGNGLTNGVLTGKLLVDHFRGVEIPEVYR